MSVNIHGNEYITVAERVTEAHKELEKITITTEVIASNPVVIKATVTTKKGTFTGISAANPNKAIEKQSPYEVAETSAVGRALGFAGYGAVESIASADEVTKAIHTDESAQKPTVASNGAVCKQCGSNNIYERVAGEKAKRPGARYTVCGDCKEFQEYVPERLESMAAEVFEDVPF